MNYVNSVWYLPSSTVVGHGDGEFRIEEPGLRDNLFEIAMKAMEKVQEVQE